MLFSCAAGWGLYIAAMVLPSTAMRRLYCALPMLFTAVPLFLTTDYALTLRGLDPTKELEHRHADLMSNRYPPAALFAAAFPAFALAGELVSLVTGASMLTGDVLFVICCAGLVVTGRYLFARRNVPELKIHAVKEEEKKPGNEA